MVKWTAEKILELRKAYGESQGTFAVRLGLTVDALRFWEQGRSPPNGSAQRLLDRLEEDFQSGDIRDPETGRRVTQTQSA